MREFAKSFSSLALAMSLFAFKQVENIATPRDRGERRGPTVKSLDAVTNATVNQFGETLRATFRTIDNVQRGIIGLGFNMFLPFLSSIGSASASETRRELRGDNEFDETGRRWPWADRVIRPPESQLDDSVTRAADLWAGPTKR
jgi:hypothetical protein